MRLEPQAHEETEGTLRPDVGRGTCPVAHADDGWEFRGHAEVVAAAEDPQTYSSAVTARRAIPNSLDGDEHRRYREIIDRFMTRERVDELESAIHALAAELVAGLPRDSITKTMGQLGTPFAVRFQSTWLGWPASVEAELVAWMQRNQEATASGDRTRTAAVAHEFDEIIRSLVDARHDRPVTDVTGELMRETVDGRPLTIEEIVSILRNWTAGDLGSLASSVGVIVQMMAVRPEVQRAVRALVEAGDDAAVEAALEEILRIDDPFVANRRRTTADVTVDEHDIEAGALVHLNWTTANRDTRVFPDPDHYDPVGHAPHNLVFGRGPHVCPGRDLTLMGLRVIIAELLANTAWIEPTTERPFVREEPPAGGWARVPVVLRARLG